MYPHTTEHEKQIAELEGKLVVALSERDELLEMCKTLSEIIAAQDNLLIAYRVGKRPSGKALDTLRLHKATQELREQILAKYSKEGIE